MSGDNEQVTFRQESVDNVFSQGQKLFFVQSPPRISTYSLTFLVFVCLLVASLFIIKLPDHVVAVGEIIAGKDYHQIVISDEEKIVKTILVEVSDKVKEGQTLFELENRDKFNRQNQMDDILAQISRIQQQENDSQTYYQQSLDKISAQRHQQLNIVNQLKGALLAEKKIYKRYQQSVNNGLIAATLVDNQQRIIADLEGQLIKEIAVFTNIDIQKLNTEESFKKQNLDNISRIERLQFQSSQLSSALRVLSPCDCVVDNLFIEQGLPVVSGQSIATLSRQRDSSSLVLYIPANEYRQIDVGSKIQVNVAAYPTNKYGALKATINSVSSSPVPGRMINKQGLGLQDATYFVVKAVVDEVPDNISLVTGMAINSDIVVDASSLFDLLFDLTAKR